jgi:hypothetical protein
LFGFNGSLKRLRQNDYMDGAQDQPQDQRLFHSLLCLREIWIISFQTAVFREPSDDAGKGADRQKAGVYLQSGSRVQAVTRHKKRESGVYQEQNRRGVIEIFDVIGRGAGVNSGLEFHGFYSRHTPVNRRVAVLAGWNPDADYFFTSRTAKHLTHSLISGDCEETKSAERFQKIFAPFVASWLSFPA